METSITFDSFAPIQSPSITSKNYTRQLFPVHNIKLYITGSSKKWTPNKHWFLYEKYISHQLLYINSQRYETQKVIMYGNFHHFLHHTKRKTLPICLIYHGYILIKEEDKNIKALSIFHLERWHHCVRKQKTNWYEMMYYLLTMTNYKSILL